VAFGDAKSILDRLHAVSKARRFGNRRDLAARAIEAQDAMTWGVAKNLISVEEFELAKVHLRKLVGA